MEDVEDNGFTLSGIREIDLVAYLAGLGYHPVEIRKCGTDHWYLSPLRNEAEASFHVNQLANEWYDFGLSQGGNLIDFCLLYYQCTAEELIEKFNTESTHRQLPVFDPSLHEGKSMEGFKLVVTGEREIYSYPLKNYLHERSVPLAVANLFCKEVSYEIGGRSYYGIGFKNNSGGYEIRNKNYKHSSTPKDITTLSFGASQVQVFEGFMDFLSYQVLHNAATSVVNDFVILNGAGLFDRALPILRGYKSGGLWLDRDVTGLAYTRYALSLGLPLKDESNRYIGFKDLNDWLVRQCTVQKVTVRPGIRQNKGGS